MSKRLPTCGERLETINAFLVETSPSVIQGEATIIA